MQKLFKIIMLSALQEQLSTKNIEYPFYKTGDKLYLNDGLTKASTPYHLYLVSDEEIKEGDWFIINKSELHQCLKLSDGQETIVFNKNGDNVGIPRKNCKKIIATTDKSLHAIKFKDTPLEAPSKGLKGIAVIPDSFIKAFVESQGAIKEVLVEYEPTEQFDEATSVGVYKLKLREDNTVIINPAKTYTREEVIKFISIYKSKISKSCEIFDTSDADKWIEQNL